MLQNNTKDNSWWHLIFQNAKLCTGHLLFGGPPPK